MKRVARHIVIRENLKTNYGVGFKTSLISRREYDDMVTAGKRFIWVKEHYNEKDALSYYLGFVKRDAETWVAY